MRQWAVPSAPADLPTLPPVALSIAGSDSGAGAGIQADLKTFAAHGVYGVVAVALVTAQSTSAVDRVHVLAPDLVSAQLNCLMQDFNIAAAKTGALGSPEVVTAVSEFLCANPKLRAVVDPVTISKHGFPLADNPTVLALIEQLLPLAEIVTPNLQEAAALLGIEPPASRLQVEQAAGALLGLGCRAVVLKGGHRREDAADFFSAPGHSEWLEGGRIETPHTHGTGCTFSAAITAQLVLGKGLLEAVRLAKRYITGALSYSQRLGRGISPVNHFWRSNPRFGLADSLGDD